jgi:hypothetical protein
MSWEFQGEGMDEKLVGYIQELRARIDGLRDEQCETSEERLANEAVIDALELVVKDLTGLIEIR